MTLWLLKMMVPISLAVTLLQHFGVIDVMARYTDPLFRMIGLPGESAVAFITGAALTTYAGIAVLLSLTLTMRQATIVALMMLLCHALPMECTVTHRTGSSFAGMVALRITMAFAAAFYLNMVLPDMPQAFGFGAAPYADAAWGEVAEGWLVSNLKVSLVMFLVIYIPFPASADASVRTSARRCLFLACGQYARHILWRGRYVRLYKGR